MGLALYVQSTYSPLMNDAMNSAPVSETIHLQYVGIHAACRATELTPGSVTVWNFGGMELVLGVERLSPKFLRVAMVAFDPLTGAKGDKVYYRRMKLDRLVGISRIRAEVAA